MTQLSVLVLQEDGWLVAQCLEMDIAVQANSFDDLWYRFQATLIGHILAADEEGTSLSDLPVAPQESWDLWQRASVSAKAERYPWIPAGMLADLPPTQMKFA